MMSAWIAVAVPIGLTVPNAYPEGKPGSDMGLVFHPLLRSTRA